MKQESTNETLILSIVLFVVATLFSYVTLMAFTYEGSESTVLAVLLYSGITLVPLIGYFAYTKMQESHRQRESLRERDKQIELYQQAISALREQRHDVLNDLALISSYVQMGRNKDALRCIDFAAANLSDRYNYHTLPFDAWTAVIELKRNEARRRGISFTTKLKEAPPQLLIEQRLLPKLTANLLDNAFEAAAKNSQPDVRIEWSSRQGHRILRVENNGPPIAESDMDKIFSPGFSSKEGEQHGWGLAICKKIAGELSGELTCHSTPEKTIFQLTLPMNRAATSQSRIVS